MKLGNIHLGFSFMKALMIELNIKVNIIATYFYLLVEMCAALAAMRYF